MGFLSTLLKIAPFAAAPFTGGASLGLAGTGTLATALPAALGGVSQILGNIAGKRQETRQQAGQFDLQNALLDLQRRKFSAEVPSLRSRQALLADFLQQPNTPVTHPRAHVVNFPGIMPGDETMQLVKNMRHQALLNQLQGDQFTPVAQQKPGFLDTALNLGAFSTGLGSVLNPLFKRPQPLPGTDVSGGGYTNPF